MKFSDAQKKLLAEKLDKSNVRPPQQYGPKGDYLEGWHVIAEANRVFDFDGWSYEALDVRCVSEAPRKIGKDKKDGWGITYIAKVRVQIGEVIREDVGAGHGYDVDAGLAHESAIKEAVTDALKRAMRTFGNIFGLALYDKTRANVADGPSPILEALLTHMPSSSLADAKAWKEREKAEIDGLSDTDFATFKVAWQTNLKTLTEAEKQAA